MAIYVYETVPQRPGDSVERFELKQSMKDPALTEHPETGVPIRRIITGGYGIMRNGEGGPASTFSGGG